jgi:putative tryptophan/tyrosine transport system substrate-binding protein
MKRREFIAALGGAAAWPYMARAQQQVTPVVGFLHARSPDDIAYLVAAFRHGLGEAGYVEGENVSIQYRFALGNYGQLPEMAAELVRRPVAVLVAGSDPVALAAKAATSNIPIVFAVGSDPIKLGLVANDSRPGGNATGMDILTSALEAKRLGLLHELMPQATIIGVLVNPNNSTTESQWRDLHEAARAIGLQIHALRSSTDAEIDAAFEAVAQEHIAVLVVAADPFLDTRRDKIVALAQHHSIPAMYQFREHAVAGGLMSYGINLPDVYRQLGIYTGKILKGTKPADLPVMQPTKFELVINLKTAKALRIEVPTSMQLLADEVIE